VLTKTKPEKKISFLFLPDNHDPDSFANKHGKEYFEEFSKKNSISIINIYVEIENVSILIAFFGAICTSLAYVTVKKLSFTEDVYLIIQYFPLVSFIALLPIVLMNWVTPTWNELVWIIGFGLFTQLGQTFLTIGLKNLPASEASTINYLQVLFGSIWGVLFFSEIININFLLGASLVLLGTIISTTKIIKRT